VKELARERNSYTTPISIICIEYETCNFYIIIFRWCVKSTNKCIYH